MPFKDPEKKKEWSKLYKEKNKEKIKEREREYREKNKDEIKEKAKKYYHTDQGMKVHRIATWKRRGVVSENFDELYDYYINCENCEDCNVELTVDRYSTATTRCLDHQHTTGLFRNVVCHSCNVKRK